VVAASRATTHRPSAGDVLVRSTRATSGRPRSRRCAATPRRRPKDLGWVPEITLDQMISEMVANDLELAKRRALLQRHGYHTPMSIEA
jgi:GDPmannose 4,6-dehydratase